MRYNLFFLISNQPERIISMNLKDRVNSIQLQRSWDIPNSELNICCITLREDIALLPSFIESYPTNKVCLLLVLDLFDNSLESVSVSTAGGTVSVPVCGIKGIKRIADLEKVFFCKSGAVGASMVADFLRSLAAFDVYNVYLYAGRKGKFGVMKALPDFYRQNEINLQKVYDFLADDASREVYAARIKALMTGDAGYLPLSEHEEYYHPVVQPQYGDIMLDGGVSDMVSVQKRFAQSVGEKGCVFGFEPIPDMAAAARKELAAFPQYHLQTAGLGETTEEVRFTYLRDSSHIAAHDSGEKNSVLCQMTSIDDFVRKHWLSRVNCIKLDVEGAEMLALIGGRETILKNHPKLIVCLYHKPSDMIDIPLYVRKLSDKYALHIAHSSCLFTDTILYAIARS